MKATTKGRARHGSSLLGLAVLAALCAAPGTTLAAAGELPVPAQSCGLEKRPVRCDPATASIAQARAAQATGRYLDALAQARCLLRTPLTRDDKLEALQILAQAATRAGEYRQAETALQQALSLSGAERRQKGRTLILLGNLHERQKRHELAQQHYRRALENFVPAENAAEIMETWFKIGDIDVAAARFEDGVRAYSNAHAAAQTPAAKARAYDYLGYAHRRLGDFDAARKLHEQAFDAVSADETGLLSRARTHNHLGLVLQAQAAYDAQSDKDRAVAGLRAALEQEVLAARAVQPSGPSGETTDRQRLGYALRAMTSIHLELASLDQPAQSGHLQNAMQSAQAALKLAQDMGDLEWRGLALHWLARVQAQTERHDEAEQALASAVALWRCLGDRYSLGYAHLIWAQKIAMPRKDYGAARAQLENALGEFASIRAEDEAATAHLHIGRVHEATGDTDAARRSYLRAIEIVEKARANLSGDENRLTFFARRLEPYEALISLLLRRAGRTSRADDIEEAFRISERARGRTLLDHLSRDLPDTSAGKRIPLLKPGEALFEYFIGVDASYLFVLRPGEPVRAVRLAVSRAGIAAAVQRFRRPFEELKSRHNPEAFIASPASFDLQTARTLYDQLVRPGKPYLAGARRLIVVPHGSLFLLPFEALVHEAPGTKRGFLRVLRETRFAIDELPAISYTISASTLALDGARPPEQRERLLAFVDPATNRRPLRHAQSELDQIAKLYDRRIDIRPKETATKPRFLSEAGHYGSLYVSAHGEFNELRPWLSGFWLSDPANPAGALVTAADIAGMDLRAQLLTIRACEVGLGRVLDGEGITGLTRALKRAGARNLVLSLWVVDDGSSAGLMTSFYRRFAGSGYPEALHEAKRELKASGAGGRAHPFFWAPFILMH